MFITKGDSGGPLSYESNGQHILIGATSFGLLGCAHVRQSGKCTHNIK